ncbi:MAG: hypothetical protein IRY91_00115, partial [Gemmatimonadaceae bacterium]|nr:hypothetical protein [Gemmatimonadaceae bacterium]
RYRPPRLHAPRPPGGARARRCGARFTEPEAALDGFALLLRLYLVAGRDSDAQALVARRLAALPAAAPRAQRAAVIDTAVKLYMDAQPARLAAAESLLLQFARDAADRIERLSIYGEMMSKASNLGDSVVARRWAQQVVAVADSLTDAERHSAEFERRFPNEGRGLMFTAVRLLIGQRLLLDSLRKSTAAFGALERRSWAQATRMRQEAFPIPVGKRAPAIKAELWFPRAAANDQWPRPGHVSIVAFLDCHGAPHPDDMHPPGGGPCGKQGAALRRWAQHFPALDIIVVGHTHGYFMYESLPEPAADAEWMHKWVEAWVPRATLAVATTPFWRLPAPDGRVIVQDNANDSTFSFGGILSLKVRESYSHQRYNPTLFLVDQDGLIVHQTVFPGGSEAWISTMIDVLLHRQSGDANVGARE